MEQWITFIVITVSILLSPSPSLIEAWSLYQILEGRRNYIYCTIQKNFNKLCLKLHSLCNNLCENKKRNRKNSFFKNFEIVNSVLLSIESRDQNESWNFF